MTGDKLSCSVCGGTSFEDRAVLWDSLAAEWQLAPHERAYVDRQQGTCCKLCGSNLRSVALSDSIRGALGVDGYLKDFVQSEVASRLAVLEINEAGTLSPYLRQMAGYRFGAYPDVDMQALPYGNDSFDLVVHSDTLEHIPQPLRALGECRRVLRNGGFLCLTVPIIAERLSRSRAGLPPSYHGNPKNSADDFRVHTEFGADAWTYLARAGFAEIRLNVVDYPSAIAMSARKTPGTIS